MAGIKDMLVLTRWAHSIRHGNRCRVAHRDWRTLRCIARNACNRRVKEKDPDAPAKAPMQPGCCPDAPQAKEEEEVGAAASPGSLEALAPHKRRPREQTNDKSIACERTNIAQLMRGCATDFSCHADHMDMRLARRDARIDKCDRHT